MPKTKAPAPVEISGPVLESEKDALIGSLIKRAYEELPGTGGDQWNEKLDVFLKTHARGDEDVAEAVRSAVIYRLGRGGGFGRR
jgi:hypothetical protein